MKQISFIHAADLHLDSPMTGLSHLPKAIFDRLKESTFTALKNLIDLAIEHKVDFVILAGDLYDEEDRSVRAQTRFRNEMLRLKAHDIQVYMIHGNHDHLEGSWIHLEMPENVHIFRENVEIMVFQKENATVHLYGFSYPSRHLPESKIQEYIKKEGADFDIGILHGHSEGISDHSVYAPFRVNELLEKKLDYWALGHIHKRTHLHEHPYIVYPGNIQGRNKKETGGKGCYLVNMSLVETHLQFIETATIEWNSIDIDGKEANTFHELYQICIQELENQRAIGKGMILSLAIHNVSLSDKELAPVKNGELLQTLQEEEQQEKYFVWPAEIIVHHHFLWEREQLEQESDFYRELFLTYENTDFAEESTRVLYDHPYTRRFLPTLAEDEIALLQEDALQKLIFLLNKA
jgi:DNA repair protein SbcD/Mre11